MLTVKAMTPFARAFLAGASLALVAPSAGASDDLTTTSRGWSVPDRFGPRSAGPMGTATVAYKYKSEPDDIYDRSLVIQSHPDGTSFLTELPGKVFHLKYAPAGDRLLVTRAGGGLDRGKLETYLLEADGDIAWSKIDNRIFSFSTTGEVIYARWEGSTPGEGGSEVEIFDLTGRSLRKLALDTATVRGVVVPDDGSSVIFVCTRSMVRLVAGSSAPAVALWSVEFPTPALYVESIDSVHFRVRLERAEVLDVRIADGFLMSGVDRRE